LTGTRHELQIPRRELETANRPTSSHSIPEEVPMAVIVKDEKKRWPYGQIPFEIEALTKIQCKELGARIGEFNKTIGIDLFVPRPQAQNKIDYVEFRCADGGQCVVGRNGGKQVLSFGLSPTKQGDWSSVWHEMGHCTGLGHENFHVGNPNLSQDPIFLEHFSTVKDKYNSYFDFDPLSIMMYGEGAYSPDKKSLGKAYGKFAEYDGKKTEMEEKGSGTLNKKLSDGDIVAIRYMYNMERQLILVS
jgi:hypothetical protein